MKILHICCGYDIDFQGGITNYVRSIARQQNSFGNEVYILTSGKQCDDYKIINVKTNLKPFVFNKRSLSNFIYLKNFFKKYNFDIIHIHMILNLDNRIFKLLKGKNVIVSLHDYSFLCPRISMVPYNSYRCERANTNSCYSCFSLLCKYNLIYRTCNRFFGSNFIESFPLKSSKVFKNWFNNYKSLLEESKLLLPVSERVKEIYKNSGINGNYKILHIGSESACNFNNINKRNISDKINLVILSTVSAIKGGDLLVKIFSKVNNPNIHIHFFGRANTDHDKKVLSMIKATNHGPYKQSELSKILVEMDFGVVCPIWEDNGPQVVMEMINNKIPVFCTKMGGIPDFVHNDYGYLFNPFSDEEIASAIEFLNKLTYEQIVNFRKNIVKTLTPSEHFDELQKIYTSICKN